MKLPSESCGRLCGCSHMKGCATAPCGETVTCSVCDHAQHNQALTPHGSGARELYRDQTEHNSTRRGWSDAVVRAVAATTEVTPTPRGRRENRDYLLGLLQQLHALVQDLAVKLSALPQDLPPHLLHRRPQILPLRLRQRLAGPPAWILLQGIIQRGLQLLDFLMQPKSHTDRLTFESSKQTTHQELEEKACKRRLRQEGRMDTDKTESSKREQWGAFHTECTQPPSTDWHPGDGSCSRKFFSRILFFFHLRKIQKIGLHSIPDKTPNPDAEHYKLN